MNTREREITEMFFRIDLTNSSPKLFTKLEESRYENGNGFEGSVLKWVCKIISFGIT